MRPLRSPTSCTVLATIALCLIGCAGARGEAPPTSALPLDATPSSAPGAAPQTAMSEPPASTASPRVEQPPPSPPPTPEAPAHDASSAWLRTFFRTINANERQLYQCTSSVPLRTNPTYGIHVEASIEVQGDGKIGEVTVSKATMYHPKDVPALADCVTRALRSLDFPPPPGGPKVILRRVYVIPP